MSEKISVLVKVGELCPFHFATRFCEHHNLYSIECVQMQGFWSVVFIGNTFQGLTGGGRETRLLFSKQRVYDYKKRKKVAVEFHTFVRVW